MQLGGNASVLNRSQKESRSQTKNHGVALNVKGGSGTSLLGIASSNGWGRALTAGVLNRADAGVLSLNLALVLERLEGVVAGTLDITSGLDVEGTLDVVESGEIDPNSS